MLLLLLALLFPFCFPYFVVCFGGRSVVVVVIKRAHPCCLVYLLLAATNKVVTSFRAATLFMASCRWAATVVGVAHA